MTQLDYQPTTGESERRRRARIFGKTAFWLAIAPQAIGITIVIAYWITDWGWLVAGSFLIPIGAIVFLIGFIYASLWALQRNALTRLTSEPLPWARVVGFVCLLISNFPVAFLCGYAEFHLTFQPRLSVLVTNNSGAPLDLCEISVSSWSKTSTTSVMDKGGASGDFRMSRVQKLKIHLVQAGKTTDLEPVLDPSFARAHAIVRIEVRPGTEAIVTGQGILPH